MSRSLHLPSQLFELGNPQLALSKAGLRECFDYFKPGRSEPDILCLPPLEFGSATYAQAHRKRLR